MHYGFRIVEDMIDGLSNYLDEKGFASVERPRRRERAARHRLGRPRPQLQVVARIDTTKCIGCKLCYVACEDGAHQCIPLDAIDASRLPVVDEHECVGCNLC